MASNTSKFSLYKKDPATDGGDTFDIKTMMNNNWDSLDENAAYEPFLLRSATYDSTNDKIDVVIGQGIVDFLSTIVEKTADTTYSILTPAVSTDYYVYIKADGTFTHNTTGGELKDSLKLWKITTGTSVDTITTTDQRGQVSGSAQRVKDQLDPRVTTLEGYHVSNNVTPATLNRGQNVLSTDQVTSMVLKAFEGLTKVNHMGWQGGFHEQGEWSANLTIDTATYKLGGSSGKIDNSAGTAQKLSRNNQKMYLTGKYILAGVWTKANGSSADVTVSLEGRDSAGALVGEYAEFGRLDIGTSWVFQWKKYDLTAKTSDHWTTRLDVDSYGTTSDIVNFDGMVVYELTSSEYSATHTQAEIEDKFAYVDDIKGITNPNWTSYGKNLFNINRMDLHSNASLTDSKTITHSNTSGSDEYNDLKIKVSPSTTYTYKMNENASSSFGINAREYDSEGNLLANNILSSGTNTLSFTTNASTDYIIFRLYTTATGTYTFTEVMLVAGDSAQLPSTYEPYNEDYLTLKDTFYAGDKPYESNGGFRVTRKNKEVILDGSLAWAHSGDFTGYKTAYITNFSNGKAKERTAEVVKFDGKILFYDGTFPFADTHNAINGNDAFHVAVSDTDTGFTDAMTPTADEWSAFFNGWEYTNNINNDATTGDVGWINMYDSADTTTDINVALSRNTHAENGKKGYFVVFELADTVDEAVEHIGTVNPTMPKGKAQVGFDEGVIRRERANPVLSGSFYYLNTTNFGISLFDYRTEKILNVYKNGKIDDLWTIEESGNAFGVERAYIPEADFDTSATYTVDYKALDYQISTHVNTSDVEYDDNIRSAVNRLIKRQGDSEDEISNLSEGKANREQEDFIRPTLINGWVDYHSNKQVAFAKYDFNLVEVVGSAKNGTIGSAVFYLPKGYRPTRELLFSVQSYDGTTDVVAVVQVYPDGRVVVNTGSNTMVSFNFLFRAEQ